MFIWYICSVEDYSFRWRTLTRCFLPCRIYRVGKTTRNDEKNITVTNHMRICYYYTHIKICSISLTNYAFQLLYDVRVLSTSLISLMLMYPHVVRPRSTGESMTDGNVWMLSYHPRHGCQSRFLVSQPHYDKGSNDFVCSLNGRHVCWIRMTRFTCSSQLETHRLNKNLLFSMQPMCILFQSGALLKYKLKYYFYLQKNVWLDFAGWDMRQQSFNPKPR